MAAVEEDVDDRFQDIDIESLLSRVQRRPLTFSRSKSVYKAPEFTQRLKGEETVDEGSDLTLSFKVTGVPQPTLRWFKDDEEVLDHPRLTVEERGDGGYRLTVHQVNKGDEAAYRCRAENTEGSCSCCFFLSVKGKPKSSKREGKGSPHKRTVSFPPMFSTIVEKVEEEEKCGRETADAPESPLTHFYNNLTLKSRQSWPSFLGDWAFVNGRHKTRGGSTGSTEGDVADVKGCEPDDVFLDSPEGEPQTVVERQAPDVVFDAEEGATGTERVRAVSTDAHQPPPETTSRGAAGQQKTLLEADVHDGRSAASQSCVGERLGWGRETKPTSPTQDARKKEGDKKGSGSRSPSSEDRSAQDTRISKVDKQISKVDKQISKVDKQLSKVDTRNMDIGSDTAHRALTVGGITLASGLLVPECDRGEREPTPIPPDRLPQPHQQQQVTWSSGLLVPECDRGEREPTPIPPDRLPLPHQQQQVTWGQQGHHLSPRVTAPGAPSQYCLPPAPGAPSQYCLPPARWTGTPGQQQPLESSNKPPETSNKPSETSNKPPETSNKPPETSNKPPEPSNKPPETSNKPPETSNKPPETSNKPRILPGQHPGTADLGITYSPITSNLIPRHRPAARAPGVSARSQNQSHAGGRDPAVSANSHNQVPTGGRGPVLSASLQNQVPTGGRGPVLSASLQNQVPAGGRGPVLSASLQNQVPTGGRGPVLSASLQNQVLKHDARDKGKEGEIDPDLKGKEGEIDPDQKKGIEGEIDPDQKKGIEGEIDPDLKGKEGETDPDLKGKEGETDPDLKGKEGETDPDLKGKEGETDPDLKGKEGETDPDLKGKEGETDPDLKGKEGETDLKKGKEGETDPDLKGKEGETDPDLKGKEGETDPDLKSRHMTLNARLSSYGNKSANKDSDSTESDGQTTELLREFIEYEKREQGRDEGKRVKLWWRATEHSDEEADQGKGSPKRSKGKKGKARDKSPDQSSRRQKPVPMYGLGPRKPDSHGQYVILHNTQYQLETDTVTTEGPLHLRPDVTSFQSETDTVTHEGLRRVHPNITVTPSVCGQQQQQQRQRGTGSVPATSDHMLVTVKTSQGTEEHLLIDELPYEVENVETTAVYFPSEGIRPVRPVHVAVSHTAPGGRAPQVGPVRLTGQWSGHLTGPRMTVSPVRQPQSRFPTPPQPRQPQSGLPTPPQPQSRFFTPSQPRQPQSGLPTPPQPRQQQSTPPKTPSVVPERREAPGAGPTVTRDVARPSPQAAPLLGAIRPRLTSPSHQASGGGKPEPKMLVWGVVPPSQGQSGAPPPPGSAGAWPSLKWARITAPLSADQGETDTGDTRDKTGVKTGGQTGVKTSGQTGVKTGGQTGQRDANPSPAHTSLIDDTKRFIDTRQTTSRPVTVWTEREKRAFYKYMGELMLALCLLTFLALLLDVSPHLFITVVLGANLTLTVFRFQITQG